jgi:hypothetical protein
MSEPTEERLLRQLNDATTVARELLTVKRELDEVARVVNEKRQWMVDQVTREFDRLINVLTTGREDGRTVPARDLRSVVRLPSLQPPADRQQSTRGRRR